MRSKQQVVTHELRAAVAKAIADAVGHGMREKCYEMADAAVNAMAERQHREGWVMVPIEPTAAMVDQGVKHENWSNYMAVRAIWKAMLNAASGVRGEK